MAVRVRTFRNTDPPRLVELWNRSFTGRGAVPLRSASPLERFLFSKPYFDPQGLFLAEDDQRLLGFAHAGLGQSKDVGGIWAIAVRPEARRQKIGTTLLQHCEEYLKQQRVGTLLGATGQPSNPFYLGLYGGSDCLGVLESDPAGKPFFLHHRFQPGPSFRVLNRVLTQPFKCSDPRFALLRQKYTIVPTIPRSLNCFERECLFGSIEPMEFVVEEKNTGQKVGRTLVWEMEGFSHRWGMPAVGIFGLEIDPAFRRQGLGKWLLAGVLRQVQDQFFELAEMQISENQTSGLQFLKTLGFEAVDRSDTFMKSLD